jgi:hypothetical protein
MDRDVVTCADALASSTQLSRAQAPLALPIPQQLAPDRSAYRHDQAECPVSCLPEP